MIGIFQFSSPPFLLLFYPFNKPSWVTIARLLCIEPRLYKLQEASAFNEFHFLDFTYTMNPRVRVQEQQDNVSSEYDSGTWVLLKFIESLCFEEEKGQSNSPLLISKTTKASPKHTTMRSTPSTKGIWKSSKQLGERPKEKVRASCVLRPRAVLSSPENDGLDGSINDLNENISSNQRKKDAGGKVGAQSKVLSNQVKKGKPSNREGGEAIKGKTPMKAKCTSAAFNLKKERPCLREGSSKSVGI